MTILATLCTPGDRIAVENLSYPLLRELSWRLRLPLAPVRTDACGMLPDALESACRSGGVKAVYLMPSCRNPTLTRMPESRRKDIVEVCRRHDVFIIEDDVYALALNPPTPALPFAALAPERTCFIAATSEILGGGLRVAYLCPPQHTLDELERTLSYTISMVPPLMAEPRRPVDLRRHGGQNPSPPNAKKPPRATPRPAKFWTGIRSCPAPRDSSAGLNFPIPGRAGPLPRPRSKKACSWPKASIFSWATRPGKTACAWRSAAFCGARIWPGPSASSPLFSNPEQGCACAVRKTFGRSFTAERALGAVSRKSRPADKTPRPPRFHHERSDDASLSRRTAAGKTH